MITLDKITYNFTYKGWENCLRFSNETVELVVTLDAKLVPRIVEVADVV